MIEKENIAADVNQSLQSVYRLLENSIRHVNEHCSATESEDYRQRIGKLFYFMIFDLWEPLYKQHPSLKPDDWKDD